jgi:hypothetical protein
MPDIQKWLHINVLFVMPETVLRFPMWNRYVQCVPYLHGMQTVFITENNNNNKFSICQVEVKVIMTYIVACVFVARGNVFTKTLPSSGPGTLLRHEPHRRHRAQQFFCCCACIRCGANVFNELLPSNVKGDTKAQRARWSHTLPFIFYFFKTRKLG